MLRRSRLGGAGTHSHYSSLSHRRSGLGTFVRGRPPLGTKIGASTERGLNVAFVVEMAILTLKRHISRSAILKLDRVFGREQKPDESVLLIREFHAADHQAD